MSWNIQKPGDYINGPLTVVGAASFQSNVGIGAATSGFGRVAIAGSAVGAGILGIDTDATRVDIQSYNKPLAINRAGNNVNFCEGGGNVGIGATVFGGLRFTIGNTSDIGAATNGFNIYTNRAVCSFVCNGAVDAAGTTFNYSWANGGQGPFIIAYAGGEAARFNSTGTFVLGGGLQSANGRGIAFPIAQSASSDANTLDDYEEGTWTPTFTFVTPGTLSINYGNRNGNYTKVGNLVTARFAITINPNQFSKGTASGNFVISGLPFNVGSTGAFYFDLAASLADQNTGTLVLANPVGGTSQIYFESISTSGARILRDYAGITAANFASTNAGYMTVSAVIQYTV